MRINAVIADAANDRAHKAIGHRAAHGAQEQAGASAETVSAAVDWASAVILATPGMPTDEAVRTTAQSLGPGITGMLLHCPCGTTTSVKTAARSTQLQCSAAAVLHRHDCVVRELPEEGIRLTTLVCTRSDQARVGAAAEHSGNRSWRSVWHHDQGSGPALLRSRCRTMTDV